MTELLTSPIRNLHIAQERLQALFNYRKPDRVPLGNQYASLGFNTLRTGGTITDAYTDPEMSFKSYIAVCDRYGWDQILQFYCHTLLGALDFGGRIRMPQGEYEIGVIVTDYPVDSPADVERLSQPDSQNTGFIPRARRFAELQRINGLPAGFLTRSPFAMAANICGIELFLKWAFKAPELCRHLMQMSLDHIFRVLALWTEYFGKENIWVQLSTPTESNQLISPKLFELLALPYHIQYHKRLKALGIRQFMLHLCGDQNLNLPIWAECKPWPHPSVLSFGHEVELTKAGEMFPEDIILGNIDPSFLLTGSPQQVYEHCRKMIEVGRNLPGGFILAPGCDISPHTPDANLDSMRQAINDFGVYEH